MLGGFCGEKGTWRKNVGNVVWGKSPREGQNSAGVDFVEGKRHRAEKRPPLLIRKRHMAEKCVQSCLRETAPGQTKCRWCGFRGEETAQGRKEASKVVHVKAALCPKNGRGVGGQKTPLRQAKCWGVLVEKSARGGKMRAKLFGGKPPRDGQNSGGVDFVERKRHRAEKKPPTLMGCPEKWKES
ncbi:hypothetical protein T11_7795 [Trichinella zimbabwensis]|uniref:Uncharacterized protein n=1 Tax=Trichinella zimbabwensis TaxID=268475 RepID=A0A0V1GU85_9BILA|nr:hypothetical protein T11_7795 [Trichinella zimbabwensis]